MGLTFARAFIGWSAYVSAAANILGFVSLIAFFAVGEPFGVINDLTTVILALSMVPVAFVLQKLHQRTAPRLSFGAFVGGVLAMVSAAALSALRVLGLVRFELTLVAVPVAFAVIGVWLVINSYLGRNSGTFPSGLIWIGIVAGGAFVLVIVGFLLGGPQHPLAAVGGLTAVICYPVWADWVGRLLLIGQGVSIGFGILSENAAYDASTSYSRPGMRFGSGEYRLAAGRVTRNTVLAQTNSRMAGWGGSRKVSGRYSSLHTLAKNPVQLWA